MKHFAINLGLLLAFVAIVQVARAQQRRDIPHASQTSSSADQYEYKETRDLVRIVKDAADLVRRKGEEAFEEFRVEGSRWRQGEQYVFVLDSQGTMLVHPDAMMEGKDERSLKDINGKPIIRGLIDAATSVPGKPEGWYHYQWPIPGELLARWKSAYVQEVTGPSGARYIVGSGMYNDRMERSFVVDVVKNAVAEIEQNGKAAFQLFRDPVRTSRKTLTFLLSTKMGSNLLTLHFRI
jgi:signal transduction histidine kinase